MGARCNRKPMLHGSCAVPEAGPSAPATVAPPVREIDLPCIKPERLIKRPGDRCASCQKVIPPRQTRSQTARTVIGTAPVLKPETVLPSHISPAIRCCPPGRPPGQAPHGGQRGGAVVAVQIFPACMNRTDVLLLVGAVYYQLGNHQQCIAFNDRWGARPFTADPSHPPLSPSGPKRCWTHLL